MSTEIQPLEIVFKPEWFSSGYYVYVLKIEHKIKGIFYYVGQTGDRNHTSARSPFYRLMGHFNTYTYTQKGTDAQLVKGLVDNDLVETPTQEKNARVCVEEAIKNGVIIITSTFFKIAAFDDTKHTAKRVNVEDIELALIQLMKQGKMKLFNDDGKIGDGRDVSNDAKNIAKKIFQKFGYKLPSGLSEFQTDLYVHLIKWKWDNITEEPVTNYKKNSDGEKVPHVYDAILPTSFHDSLPHIYEPIREELQALRKKHDFRTHKHFYHMASSQAANINLFMPVLLHPKANEIFRQINPDFKKLATDQLYKGFRIEFWDEPYGNLKDKTEISGTDSDIGIAYYNHSDELCLWLVEHKLTEAEFTNCGGYKSKGKKQKHDCNKTFSEIVADKSACYYHDVRRFEYWNITEKNQDFFVNHAAHTNCPFQKGMNQLWRNQLLALSIEQDSRQPFKHVYFSVVHHPENNALDASIKEYKNLIADNPKFSVFTSKDVVAATKSQNDSELNNWIEWYKGLYNHNPKAQW